MGIREQIKGRRVYFDANIFIYLAEGFPQLASGLNGISNSLANREAEIFTSELTLCEVLVPAFRLEKMETIAFYRRFIEESGAFHLVPTTREIYIRASLFRAQYGLKTPDAIHVATALDAECSAFVTNDRMLKMPKHLEKITLTLE